MMAERTLHVDVDAFPVMCRPAPFTGEDRAVQAQPR